MPDVIPGVESPLVPTLESTPAPERQETDERSSVEADQRAFEQLEETEDDILHAEDAPTSPVAVGSAAQSTEPASTVKDEVVVEVEKILEDGMGPFYASLPDDARPLFKKRGEEAAKEISTMVRTFHVQAKRVLELITRWLRTIPGVNRFFLEQEAKIKTDRIVVLEEERRKDGG